MILRSILVLASVLFCGCATRLTQFQNFSQAGISYTKASRTVLQEAGAEAIEADSVLLLRARPAGEAERTAALKTSNDLLRTRLRLLADLQRHSLLLESYFQAIADLADEKSAKPAADAAKNLASALTKSSATIKGASIGGISVASKLPAVVKLAVRRMRTKALETELQARAEIIEREIALQEAALAVVNEAIQTDRKIWLFAAQSEQVARPFERAAELPDGWTDRRRRILMTESRVASAEAAAKAAAKLREAFIALVQRGDSDAQVAVLIAEAKALVAEVV